MYIKTYLEQFSDNKVKIFVDMDGVVADYNFGVPYDFHLKRPLFYIIDRLEEISKLPNVELYIFSATRLNEGFDQKQGWLDKYIPFIKRENRIILSREANHMAESSKLKSDFMKDYKRDGSIIVVIDDDPANLRAIKSVCDDIILLKETVLID